MNGGLNGWDRFSGLVQALEKAADARGDTLTEGVISPDVVQAQGAAHDLGAQPRPAAAARGHAELRPRDDRGRQGVPEGERDPADGQGRRPDVAGAPVGRRADQAQAQAEAERDTRSTSARRP